MAKSANVQTFQQIKRLSLDSFSFSVLTTVRTALLFEAVADQLTQNILAIWGAGMTRVRVLASHQCGPGSIPRLGVKCGLKLLLVLVLAPRDFSLGTPVFPSPQKPTFPNSNLIQNPRATGLTVATDCQVSPSLNKVDLFIYLFIYLSIYLFNYLFLQSINVLKKLETPL